MSFWTTSEGTQATGEVQENSDFAPLSKGDYISMLEEATVDEYEGQKKVKLKARVVGDGPGKNRVLFLNLKCWDEDSKKRDRAIQLLVKMFNICKAPLPKGEPTDADLAKICDKPMSLKLDVWKMEINGEEKSGNWLVNADSVAAKVGAKPAAAAKPAKPAAMPAARQEAQFSDMDDDIPF